jgi:hypothetical protein
VSPLREAVAVVPQFLLPAFAGSPLAGTVRSASIESAAVLLPESVLRTKDFVERFPEVARSYARQTERLREIIRCVGFVTGGLPGSRLLTRLAIGVSGDTVLRCLKVPPVADSEEQQPSST